MQTKTNAETSTLLVGREVVMTSENSNWEVGEVGVVVAYWPREERLAVAFAARGDDVTDEHAGYTAALADCMDMAHPAAAALVASRSASRRAQANGGYVTDWRTTDNSNEAKIGGRWYSVNGSPECGIVDVRYLSERQ